MKRPRSLSVASVNLSDLNDKLGIISGLTQFIDEQGHVSAEDVNGISFYTQQLKPSVVNANSESTQTFTIKGLSVGDCVIVTKPTKQAGLSLIGGDAYIPTTNTLSLTFRNFTGGNITPTANEMYFVVSFRRGS